MKSDFQDDRRGHVNETCDFPEGIARILNTNTILSS